MTGHKNISTHTPLARCDDEHILLYHFYQYFYSHTSCEVWQHPKPLIFLCFLFILTHLLRGVTNIHKLHDYLIHISTHTPLARCDDALAMYEAKAADFYSHTSCEVWHFVFEDNKLFYNFYSHTSCEVWPRSIRERRNDYWFLLTHLLRGVTEKILFASPSPRFLLTHLLRGVTCRCCFRSILLEISTHTPLARCDTGYGIGLGLDGISTHTPLARCDLAGSVTFGRNSGFLLTHLLRGVTHQLHDLWIKFIVFLLTHLLRGVTLIKPNFW